MEPIFAKIPIEKKQEFERLGIKEFVQPYPPTICDPSHRNCNTLYFI